MQPYHVSGESLGFDRYLYVSRNVQCFFWYCLPPLFKLYPIRELFHPFFKRYSFEVLNYLH